MKNLKWSYVSGRSLVCHVIIHQISDLGSVRCVNGVSDVSTECQMCQRSVRKSQEIQEMEEQCRRSRFCWGMHYLKVNKHATVILVSFPPYLSHIYPLLIPKYFLSLANTLTLKFFLRICACNLYLVCVNNFVRQRSWILPKLTRGHIYTGTSKHEEQED